VVLITTARWASVYWTSVVDYIPTGAGAKVALLRQQVYAWTPYLELTTQKLLEAVSNPLDNRERLISVAAVERLATFAKKAVA
jgi:hypothetical protein